jgi:hypothetical protein
MLKALPADALVVITDARDVILNYKYGQVPTLSTRIRNTFHQLVKDRSVLISAEAGCCVGALTYMKPGDLFDATGRRTGRACHSGKPNCTWNGDEQRFPWEGFMTALAQLRTGRYTRDAYLNAGLMAGTASDLLHLIDMMDIKDEEDDQAVLTDLLHHAPNRIQLDYGQELFGNNRHMDGDLGCVFTVHRNNRTLVHKELHTSPAFVHSPGKFFQCHDSLTRSLYQQVVQHDWRLRSNYGLTTHTVRRATKPNWMVVGALGGVVGCILLIYWCVRK